MEISDVDSFITKIADAVAQRIDEQAKINMIAQAVLLRLKEMDEEKERETS